MKTLREAIERLDSEPGTEVQSFLRDLHGKLVTFFEVDFRDDELNDEAVEINKLLG